MVTFIHRDCSGELMDFGDIDRRDVCLLFNTMDLGGICLVVLKVQKDTHNSLLSRDNPQTSGGF